MRKLAFCLCAAVFLLGSTLLHATITVSLTALNVANRHLLIGNSPTFGGFHYHDPR